MKIEYSGTDKFNPRNHKQNMEVDANGMPKWNRNRCPKSTTINAKTGSEKDEARNKARMNPLFIRQKYMMNGGIRQKASFAAGYCGGGGATYIRFSLHV